MAHINKKKLADSVIEEIKRMLREGELKVGQKLPNQHEFAAQLGVSRTVLREALQTLALFGVIEQRPKQGTVIKAFGPALYADHLTPPFMSDERAALELIEARRFIEAGAVELAVQRITKEQLREMGHLIEEMAKALQKEDVLAYTEKNVAFHFLIGKASQNRFIIHLMATIRGFMEQWMQESVTVLPGLLNRSLKSHRAIYQALKKRELRKAVSSMKRHLLDLETSFHSYQKIRRREGSASSSRRTKRKTKG